MQVGKEGKRSSSPELRAVDERRGLLNVEAHRSNTSAGALTALHAGNAAVACGGSRATVHRTVAHQAEDGDARVLKVFNLLASEAAGCFRGHEAPQAPATLSARELDTYSTRRVLTTPTNPRNESTSKGRMEEDWLPSLVGVVAGGGLVAHRERHGTDARAGGVAALHTRNGASTRVVVLARVRVAIVHEAEDGDAGVLQVLDFLALQSLLVGSHREYPKPTIPTALLKAAK